MSKEQIIRFLPTIVLLLPLISAVLILLFTQRYRKLSAGLSTGAVAIGLGISIFLFASKARIIQKQVATLNLHGSPLAWPRMIPRYPLPVVRKILP